MKSGIKAIYPWLYSIREGDVYSYLIIGENEALLFDTGYGVISLPDTIKSVTAKPVTVILGHGHIDHACGAYQFPSVYLHEADFDLCRKHTSTEFRNDILSGLENGGKNLEGFDPEAYKTAGTGNLIRLNTANEINLGGLTVQIIEMPGHTSGSIGILIKEKRTLITSDSANDHLWLFLDESLSINEYIATLEKTFEQEFDTFFIGHSDEPKPKSDFQKYISAAKNADFSKAKPYKSGFDGLNPYIYTENGVSIVFNERTLGRKQVL